MEFKKPNRYNSELSQRNASRHGDPTLVPPYPARQSIPASDPSVTQGTSQNRSSDTTAKSQGVTRRPLPTAAAVIFYVRRFVSTKKGIVSILLTIGIVSVATWSLIHQDNAAKNTANSGNPNEVVQELEYQTILPDGKSISELGGWRRVSPSESDPVFAYTDKIGTTSVNVSQQPLPKSFIGATDDQVAELAKKFNATTKIDASGIKIYVGSSSKGPQSAIFTKNSLLILIKSQEKIDDSAWIKYVKSLN